MLRGRRTLQREVDALYGLLYRMTHDAERAPDMAALRTQETFAYQWSNLSAGNYLLSDPWFKANVPRILCEEELQVRAEWFRGKDVLDAGCGNGRWAFGFASLGANVTAVDITPAGVEATRKALEAFDVDKHFHVAPLEALSVHLPPRRYDLVFSWGALHHCQSFTQAFSEVSGFVKEGGLLYLYLYGRETLDLAEDVELFKLRLRFHLMSPEDKQRFLSGKAGGDPQAMHNLHDFYGPMINRRFHFAEIKKMLEHAGFQDVTRTIQDTELYIRAVKGDSHDYRAKWFLPAKEPPYWFHHHRGGW